MGNKVVHYEILGQDAAALHTFYGDLFGWEIDTDNPMGYGTVQPQGDGAIGGGVGQAPAGSQGFVTFYVETDDVGEHLKRAEAAGGSIMMPETEVMEGLTIGLFGDPEGHPVGLVKTQG